MNKSIKNATNSNHNELQQTIKLALEINKNNIPTNSDGTFLLSLIKSGMNIRFKFEHMEKINNKVIIDILNNMIKNIIDLSVNNINDIDILSTNIINSISDKTPAEKQK